MDAILIRRVQCDFGRRQGKNQPAMTSIHGFESEDIAKERSICLGVLAVDNYVSTRNHFPLLEEVGNSYQVAQPNQANRRPEGRRASAAEGRPGWARG